MKKQNFIQPKELLLLIVGAIIYSIGTQCFITPADIAPGGAMGIALMVHHLTNLPVGTLTLCVNIPLLILAWFYLSRRFAIRTAITCIICSVMVDFVVAPNLPMYEGDRLLSSLYGGVIIGIGMAFIFLAGSTTGGSDIAGYLVQKKWPHVSIGRLLLAIDGVILSTSTVVFGNIDAALFGLVCLYAQTKVIDTIIYGNDAGSQVTVVTRHAAEISEKIIQVLDRSATLLDAKGAYSGSATQVVLCTVRKSEFSRLKKIIHEIDKDAFVMVTETSQVFGLGFKDFAEQM
ncbi:MAG: YitT family protein [Pygmaiobacter massiliensis]|nr:YitT family protein [Pygmaiobacter massiliensis]